jgi:hypothetical protein
MVATAVADTIANARASVQVLTEKAVENREASYLLGAELIVSAIDLAKELAQQLHAYGLNDKLIAVGSEPNPRIYGIDSVSVCAYKHKWSVNLEWRKGICITRYNKNGWPARLLWDPSVPERTWDLTKDAYTRDRVFISRIPSSRSRHRLLADDITLADFAEDALAILECVAEREHQHRQHLNKAIVESEAVLKTLMA